MGELKHAVMYVPRTGLFFSGGDFIDGRQMRVPWRRIIPVYRTYSAACVARDKIKAKWRDVEGEFIVVSVEIQEKDDPAPDIFSNDE